MIVGWEREPRIDKNIISYNICILPINLIVIFKWQECEMVWEIPPEQCLKLICLDDCIQEGIACLKYHSPIKPKQLTID